MIRGTRREELMNHLKQRQIDTEIYYPLPMHLQECFAGLGYAPGAFPVSEWSARETLALPAYPELSQEMLAAVVQAIADFYANQPGSRPCRDARRRDT